MGGNLWKLTAISVILLAGAGVAVWWLERWAGRSINTTIPDPQSLTPAEVERLIDMPDYIISFGSDDEFTRWLRHDGMSSLPRPNEFGSIIWQHSEVQPPGMPPRRE